MKGKDIQYVQYGCGFSNPEGWLNFDASPTLRIQRTPLIGSLLRSKLNVVFPGNIFYGDILKGLPVAENSIKGIYCSHVLEHLSFNDCKLAISNTYKYLQQDGIFRCVVPDIEIMARDYLKALDKQNFDASNDFIRSSLMGIENRPKGFKGFISSYYGNSHHLWMWDSHSLRSELIKAGFRSVRDCVFNDSTDEQFKLVEDESRFIGAVALEAIK